MKLTNRFTAIAVGIAAVGILLSGCGSNTAQSAQTKDGKPLLKVAVSKYLTKPMAEIKWVDTIKEKCGCEIEWQEVSSDWDQKKQAMFVSGDIPDVILKGVSISDMATYSSLFTDLSQDIDKMPNVKSMFDADPTAKEIVTSGDGKIYGLPADKKGIWPKAFSHMFINKQWLDKLGLEVPTTWDELFTVLQAFKTQDPNGNGKQDEIPWSWAPVGTGGFGDSQPTLFMGSLGLPMSNTGGTGYFVEDGVVKNFLIDDRYKEVIEYVNKTWEAGLIDQKVFTQDYSQFQSSARGNGDVASIGFTWGWSASDRFGPQLASQYEAIGQLKAKKDQTNKLTWDNNQTAFDYGAYALTISAKTPNRDTALKFADAFYDQDVSIQVLWGDFGTATEKVSDNEYKVLPPADSTKDPSTWKWSQTIADDSPYWIRPDLKIELPSDLAEAKKQEEPLKEALDNVDPDKDLLPKFLKFSADDQNTLQLNNTTILSTAMPKFSEWITKGGVDQQWDEYVQTLKAANLEQNIDIYQKSYDEYMKK